MNNNNKKFSHIIGAIFIFAGTCIGGGVLSLPIITASSGFVPSLCMFVLSAMLLATSGLYIIEVNLWLPDESNIISMAKKTLGTPGQMLAWVTYLFLMYLALTAYLIGILPTVQKWLITAGIHLNQTTAAVLFSAIFGTIIFCGTQGVDYINRLLMIGLLLSYVFLIITNAHSVQLPYLMHMDFKQVFLPLPIIVASFTGHMVLPSLRTYLKSDARALFITIMAGCFIPLVMYILWDLITLGVIPLDGAHGLLAIAKSPTQVYSLQQTFSDITKNYYITQAFDAFIICAILTSFLGVSLSLADFLRDGFKMQHTPRNWAFCVVTALLPPLVVKIYDLSNFTDALYYVGVAIVILLILLPVAMTWAGRYVTKIAHGYRTPGGKPLLLLVFVFGLVTISGYFI